MDSREFQLKIKESDKELLNRYRKAHPVKLAALARQLGVVIKVARLPFGVSGKISREGKGEDKKYIIRVNRFEKRERQRFTIAHEIAHFLLHRDLINKSEDGITDNVLYRSGAPLSIEFEANRLAADIIMPLGAIKEKKTEFFGDNPVDENIIEHLAEIFEVSNAAMEVRLSQLVG